MCTNSGLFFLLRHHWLVELFFEWSWLRWFIQISNESWEYTAFHVAASCKNELAVRMPIQINNPIHYWCLHNRPKTNSLRWLVLLDHLTDPPVVGCFIVANGDTFRSTCNSKFISCKISWWILCLLGVCMTYRRGSTSHSEPHDWFEAIPRKVSIAFLHCRTSTQKHYDRENMIRSCYVQETNRVRWLPYHARRGSWLGFEDLESTYFPQDILFFPCGNRINPYFISVRTYGKHRFVLIPSMASDSLSQMFETRHCCLALRCLFLGVSADTYPTQSLRWQQHQ